MDNNNNSFLPRDIFEIIWNSKLFIAICTITFTLIGISISLLIKPSFLSYALISPKENSTSKVPSGILSQLGGLVGSQFNTGGISLGKLEVIIKSRDVAEKVVSSDNFLHIIFSELWDKKENEWNKSLKHPPSIQKGMKKFIKMIDIQIDAKKNIMRLGVISDDSVKSLILVRALIKEVENKIQNDIVAESNTNLEFLDKRINSTSDPLVREKIQILIGQEIEKIMLYNSKPFEILDKPRVPEIREKPNRKLITILFFILGFTTSCLYVISLRLYNRENKH